MEKLEASGTVDGNVKWYSSFGKHSGITEKVKHMSLHDPAISLTCIFPGGIKTYVYTTICTNMFIAALLIIAKTQKQLKRPSGDEWIDKRWPVHGMNDYSAIEKD